MTRDYEEWKEWVAVATERFREALEVPEHMLPVPHLPHCRHFDDGTEQCSPACLVIFGDAYREERL